jgi:hypothetical protein
MPRRQDRRQPRKRRRASRGRARCPRMVAAWRMGVRLTWSVMWFQGSLDPAASRLVRRAWRMEMIRSAMPCTPANIVPRHNRRSSDLMQHRQLPGHQAPSLTISSACFKRNRALFI